MKSTGASHFTRQKGSGEPGSRSTKVPPSAAQAQNALARWETPRASTYSFGSRSEINASRVEA
jgi:hypothetical protein